MWTKETSSPENHDELCAAVEELVISHHLYTKKKIISKGRIYIYKISD
jgi:hypothetical protein